MKRTVHKAARLEGILKVPGDKSISHRALILGAAAHGRQVIDGLSDAARRTHHGTGLARDGLFCRIHARRAHHRAAQLAARGVRHRRGKLRDDGAAIGGLCRGARKTVPHRRRRVAAAAPDGARRRTAGAHGRARGARQRRHLPGDHRGRFPARHRVRRFRWRARRSSRPSSSRDSSPRAIPPSSSRSPTRDHTEIMLAAMGVEVLREGSRIAVRGGSRLEGIHVTVPGDISSAAFFIVAALIRPGSPGAPSLRRRQPAAHRCCSTVLRAMGADIAIEVDHGDGEAACDLTVRSARTARRGNRRPGRGRVHHRRDSRAARWPPPRRTARTDRTRRRRAAAQGVGSHRRDRVQPARAWGRALRRFEDGFVIEGPTPLRGAPVSSFGDHRIAMAMTVAGLAAEGTHRDRRRRRRRDLLPGLLQRPAGAGPRAVVPGVEAWLLPERPCCSD